MTTVMALQESSSQPEQVATAGAPEAEASGILSIDLSAIEENWRTLARRTMPADCAAVIKADAYGCGLEPVARQLSRAGCKTFFIADLGEARRLRAVAPEAVIYVLNGLMPGTAPTFAELHARPVIGSMVELAEWDAFCSTSSWRGGAALQVDTGMNRLGITADEAAAVAPRIRSENHGVTLLMSHFACAETPEHPLNDRQIRLFREVRILFRGIPASLANSSGIFLGNAAHCDLVRPGVALFGANPTPGRPNPMRPVVELRGRILQVRTVARGETVGYGAIWTARHATKVAVVGIGYADGLLRAASASDDEKGANAVVAGKMCPLAGRISMDLSAIDVGALPDGSVRRGDWATIIGDGITVDDLAERARTISYEVLTDLGRRYHRVYRAS